MSKKEVGIVKSFKNDLVCIEGLPSVYVNDVLQDHDGSKALVVSYADDSIEALLLSNAVHRPGDILFHDNEGLRIPTGEEVLGRVVNPLGKAIDGGGPIGGESSPLQFEVVAPGVSSRELIKEQFYTGVTTVDTLVPIGKGQRELVFGEPDSGKQFFLRDIVMAQRDSDVICIYAAIGKSAVKVKRFADSLEAVNSLGHTVIIAASAGSPTSHFIIAPSVAMVVAESFRGRGRDVLVILDDLGTHAKYLRELALLSRRIPGRESYPGDIFYQHAHIMERAGNFNETVGGGSITLLPVMELDIEQFSTLIPTNLIASTDGHIYFSSRLAAEGVYPAIEVDRSVTRVGRRAQTSIQVEVSERVRSLLSSFRDLERYSHLGAEIGGAARETLHRGAVARELLRQDIGALIDWRLQVLFLSLAFLESIMGYEASSVAEQRNDILKRLSDNSALLNLVEVDGQSVDTVVAELEKASLFT